MTTMTTRRTIEVYRGLNLTDHAHEGRVLIRSDPQVQKLKLNIFRTKEGLKCLWIRKRPIQ